MLVPDYSTVLTAAQAGQASQFAPVSASQNGSAAASAAANPNSPRVQKLRQAAAEFEGMLISSLWKSMKSSFSNSDDDSDDSTDPAHDTLSDLGIDTMSNAVAKAGGLGLGKLLLKHLEPMLAKSQSENPPSFSGKASALPADVLCSGGSSDPFRE